EYPAASPQHSSTPTVAQVEEARVQQPTEDLGKQEQEAVHTESVAEVQQESPAASPQHSTTPTITQARCGVSSPKSLKLCSGRSKRHACTNQQKISANKSKRQSIWSRLQRCSRNLLQPRPNIAPHQLSHRSKRHACSNQQKNSANKSKRQSIQSQLQRCSRNLLQLRPNIAPHQPSHRSKRHACS
ncbi:unnamed protein product, partial [Durusdinium trenchii]